MKNILEFTLKYNHITEWSNMSQWGNLCARFYLTIITSPSYIPFHMLCSQCCVGTFPSGGGVYVCSPLELSKILQLPPPKHCSELCMLILETTLKNHCYILYIIGNFPLWFNSCTQKESRLIFGTIFPLSNKSLGVILSLQSSIIQNLHTGIIQFTTMMQSIHFQRSNVWY